MNDVIEQFRQAIGSAGLPPPDTINADGAIHRFSTNGKRSDDSGWYVLHLDGVPAGSFGCWRNVPTVNWCGKVQSDMTQSEREAHQHRVHAMKAQRDSEQVQRNAAAAVEASKRFKAAATCTSHQYQTTKGVHAHGIKIEGDNLLIPMRDTAGTLHSLQTITPEGDKRFFDGGRVKGCYHSIGKPNGKLIIGEGYATCASIHEATGDAVAAAFTAVNLLPVALALRAKYPDMQLILAADDDYRTAGNPGLTKATAAAQAVGGLLAVPEFPAGRGDKDKDFNDLCKLSGADAVRRCIDAAKPCADANLHSWPEPEPLSAFHAPLPYPLDALPKTVLKAVEEVVGFVKAPVALVASSALSAMSVAIQGLYDVERAPGLKGPCSLFMLSIAESGERKTTCDGYFKQAIETHQREKSEALKPQLENYKADLTVWDAKKAGIAEAVKKAMKNGESTAAHEADMRQLEQDKPKIVRVPKLIRGDDTPENLSWAMMREWPSAGVLSSEAGVVFGAHGMGSESVTRNLALLNVLWDGGSIPIGRKTTESFTVEGVRLTMGLQVQEVPLRTFFDKSKGLARGTGFLARFLIAWPESTMGTRKFTAASDGKHLAVFHSRITELLQKGLSIDDDGRLTTTILPLSAEAHNVWVAFHDEIESKLAPDGELHDVKDVAAKVADNAARIAAQFQVFEHDAGVIGVESMRGGAKVAAWHLSEARRFLGQFALPPELDKANRLDGWLLNWCRREGVTSVSTRDAAQRGPLRDKGAVDTAVAVLEELGRARIFKDGKKRLIQVNPALLGIAP